MILTLQVDPDVAAALRSGSSEPIAAAQIKQLCGEAAAIVRPQHHATGVPQLDTFFTVEVPDKAGLSLQKRLAQICQVLAVYSKPEDETPGQR